MKLTNRQQQIANLLLQGYSLKEAARELHLSYPTVRQVMLAARKRTGAETTAQMLTALATEDIKPE